MKCVGHIARMGNRRGAYRVLVRRPDAKRQLRRYRHRGENNIIGDLQEMGRRRIDWIDMAHFRDRWRALINAVMKLP